MVGLSSVKTFHSDEYRRFAGLLKEARLEAGLTQEELAGRLGVKQFFISKYESGRRRLDVLQFLTIAAAIGTDYRRILEQLDLDAR